VSTQNDFLSILHPNGAWPNQKKEQKIHFSCIAGTKSAHVKSIGAWPNQESVPSTIPNSATLKIAEKCNGKGR
jgi:hypothetical protein